MEKSIGNELTFMESTFSSTILYSLEFVSEGKSSIFKKEHIIQVHKYILFVHSSTYCKTLFRFLLQQVTH